MLGIWALLQSHASRDFFCCWLFGFLDAFSCFRLAESVDARSWGKVRGRSQAMSG